MHRHGVDVNDKAVRLIRVFVLSLTFTFIACRDVATPVAPRSVASAPARANSVKDGAAIVLRGTIITPAGMVKHGYVEIVNGRIASVSDKQPDIEDAIDVNTEGIILPGLVDVHNHVPWNVLALRGEGTSLAPLVDPPR